MEKISLKKQKTTFLIAIIVVGLLLSTVPIRKNVIDYYTINGYSMSPTLENESLVFINKLTENYNRGDIILVKRPDYSQITRVIGLPNDRVEIKDGKVMVNGALLEEPYISNQEITRGSVFITLKTDQYYILGDNRKINASLDSREFGPISKKEIIGKLLN